MSASFLQSWKAANKIINPGLPGKRPAPLKYITSIKSQNAKDADRNRYTRGKRGTGGTREGCKRCFTGGTRKRNR